MNSTPDREPDVILPQESFKAETHVWIEEKVFLIDSPAGRIVKQDVISTDMGKEPLEPIPYLEAYDVKNSPYTARSEAAMRALADIAVDRELLDDEY